MNLKDLIVRELSEHLGRPCTMEEYRNLAPLLDVSKGFNSMQEVLEEYDRLYRKVQE